MQPKRFLLRRSARRARIGLARQLACTVPPAIRDNAILLVSEFVTNAVVHAVTPCTVAVDINGLCLRVEVADGTAERPAVPEPSSPSSTVGSPS